MELCALFNLRRDASPDTGNGTVDLDAARNCTAVVIASTADYIRMIGHKYLVGCRFFFTFPCNVFS